MKKLLRVIAVADSGTFLGVQSDMTGIVATPIGMMGALLERDDLITFEIAEGSPNLATLKNLSDRRTVAATIEAINVPASKAVIAFLAIASWQKKLVRVGSITIDPDDRGASLVLLQRLE